MLLAILLVGFVGATLKPIQIVVGLASANTKLCEQSKRNDISLPCVFALLDTAHGDPNKLKEIELMLIASQMSDKRDTEGLPKRNAFLCERQKRNDIDLACVFALLDSAHGDAARLKEIETMLIVSQASGR